MRHLVTSRGRYGNAMRWDNCYRPTSPVTASKEGINSERRNRSQTCHSGEGRSPAPERVLHFAVLLDTGLRRYDTPLACLQASRVVRPPRRAD